MAYPLKKFLITGKLINLSNIRSKQIYFLFKTLVNGNFIMNYKMGKEIKRGLEEQITLVWEIYTPEFWLIFSVKFLFGGLSGMGATCFVQPLDLVKTRMQVSIHY